MSEATICRRVSRYINLTEIWVCQGAPALMRYAPFKTLYLRSHRPAGAKTSFFSSPAPQEVVGGKRSWVGGTSTLTQLFGQLIFHIFGRVWKGVHG